MKAIIAVSGGMDSCVTAAIAKEEYELAFAHFNYGQRTQQRELKAFNEIADYYGIKERMIFDMSYFSRIGSSSLTDYSMTVSQADLNSKEIPSSYVPFRNGNILAACVSWAEGISARAIFIGAVYEDASGYPDCRPEFYEAFEKMVKIGTKPDSGIVIKTPIIHMTKEQIIKKGIALNLSHTHI